MANVCMKWILTTLSNSQLPVAKTFMCKVGLQGTLNFITWKKKFCLLFAVLFILSFNMYAFHKHLSTMDSVPSVALGALGRRTVIEDCVLFDQGNHYKAVPSTQSQCNMKTSTGMPHMCRRYQFSKWLRWKFYELFSLEMVLWSIMFLFHFFVLYIIWNRASVII